MKSHLLIASLLSIFLYQTSCSQVEMPKYPKYKEVEKQFFTRYTTKIDDNENQFILAKKPDGWHAMLLNYQTNKVVKDELYWSRKKNEYIEIDFPHYVQAGIDKNQNYLPGNSWASELVPYWGYDGWEIDVIKEFAGKNNLSDNLLNAVARAYSSYSKSFTNQSSNSGDPGDFKKLPKGQNALSPEILAKYLENQHLSFEYYYKLYKRNPKFETFVANIYDVYSNEIMNSFLTLRYYQNEETAKKELKKGLYSPFYIEMAKNYLNSCDSNAILFTNGDMDTYPLLYVQETENFRKDVLVVNLSMLNSGRYIYQLANFKAGAKPLKLSMDPEIYKSETKDIFVVIADIDKPFSVVNILKLIASKDENTKYKTSDNQLYDKIPTKDLYFVIDKDKMKKMQEEKLSVADTSFNMHLQKNYLNVSDLCVLDILATNNFERPIYFASTVGNENYSTVKNYLSYEAYALKINPIIFSNIDNNYYKCKVFSDILSNKIFNKLKFDKKNYSSLGASQKLMVNNYRLMFSMLAGQLIEENKNEKALQALDYCIDLFPNEVCEYDYYMIDFIRNYFRIKQETKAKNLLVVCMKEITNDIESLKKAKKDEDVQGNLRIKIYTLDELYKISREFMPNDQITNDLRTKFEKYMQLIN